MAGSSLKGVDIREALERVIVNELVVPKRAQCDNGSEFISKEVDRWAYENQVVMDFSRPGKPTDNPYVKSFLMVNSEMNVCPLTGFCRWNMLRRFWTTGSESTTPKGRIVHLEI